MADLFLVRHGQASLFSANYDQLSPLGEDQSRRLGLWLAECGQTADAVATGGLTRQLDTASQCLAAMAWPPPQTDWLTCAGLREIDTGDLISRLRPDLAAPEALQAELSQAQDPRRAFQTLYAAAVARWTGGRHAAEYRQSWEAFQAQGLATLDELTALPHRAIFAFTSGGPIAVVIQHLLAIPDAHAFDVTWSLVNTGVTRIRFSGKTGARSLSVLNAHPHLERANDPALVSYR